MCPLLPAAYLTCCTLLACFLLASKACYLSAVRVPLGGPPVSYARCSPHPASPPPLNSCFNDRSGFQFSCSVVFLSQARFPFILPGWDFKSASLRTLLPVLFHLNSQPHFLPPLVHSALPSFPPCHSFLLSSDSQPAKLSPILLLVCSFQACRPNLCCCASSLIRGLGALSQSPLAFPPCTTRGLLGTLICDRRILRIELMLLSL